MADGFGRTGLASSLGQYDPYDEESRFQTHSLRGADDTIRGIMERSRGVRSVTVIELASGDVVLSTLFNDDEAAKLAEHVPTLLHRAGKCLRGSTTLNDGTTLDDELQMLCISSRSGELLITADALFAIVVEQDRAVGGWIPEKAVAKLGAALTKESRYRRLLVSSSSDMPGHFAGGEFEDEADEEADDEPPFIHKRSE